MPITGSTNSSTAAASHTTPTRKRKKLSLNTEDEIYDFVHEAHADVMKLWDNKQKILLQKHLEESLDPILAAMEESKALPLRRRRRVYKRLLTNGDAPSKIVQQLYCQPCNEEKSTNECGATSAAAAVAATGTNANTTTSLTADAINASILNTENNNNNNNNNTPSEEDLTSDDDHHHPTAPPTIKPPKSVPPFSVKMRGDKQKLSTLTIGPSRFLQATTKRLPSSSATIFLKTHYATEDEQNLKYVPYFGDDDKDDVVSDLYNLEDRQKQMEFGAEYEERKTNDLLDAILELMETRLKDEGINDSSRTISQELCTAMHEILATIMDEYQDRIHQRYELVILKKIPPSKQPAIPTAGTSPLAALVAPTTVATTTTTTSPKKHTKKKVESYLDAMDTYRPLFCRRCFIYDCNMHSNLQKPSLQLQGELAIQRERDGFWTELEEQEAELNGKVSSSNDAAAVASSDDDLEDDKKPAAKIDDDAGKDAEKKNDDDKKDDDKSMQDVEKVMEDVEDKQQDNSKKDKQQDDSKKGAAVDDSTTEVPDKDKEAPSATDDVKKSVVPSSTADDLTPVQKAICERMFLIFQGDTQQMASTMGAPESAIVDYCRIKDFKLEKDFKILSYEQVQMFQHAKGKRKKRNFEQSMNNYNPTWLKRVDAAEIHPVFVPCDHELPCSETTCSCVQNAFFCTKHCCWERRSRNFFRGCACNGRCTTKSCSCFAAKRECDPDLCRTCGACTDPANAPPTSKQRCRNDNIGMRRHAHLLLAKSQIEDAGWGIYNRYALKKGDYIHEYVGEVISQEEAERRGRIYDKVNRSYLFNLSSDYVVDASRKGNKTRFANHSNKPNSYARMVDVNGDIRIGLFAKEDIEPQTEIFFDYRYDVGMDNDLIIKPGMTVDWMKNPKMANKISKKYASEKEGEQQPPLSEE